MIRRWLRTLFDRQPLHPAVVTLRFLRRMGLRHLPFVARHAAASRAQLCQDLFVLIERSGKRAGYFVEVGAADGEHLSNTWLLEKRFGWRGILAEPNRAFLDTLRARRSARVDARAVWRSSGRQLPFLDVAELRELSTLKDFQAADHYARAGAEYLVETVSLNDLLAAHGAPSEIDYISIDTEGSELEILEGFDFERHRVHVFTIEHNFAPDRLARMTALLAARGYRRVLADYTRFDAWFVSGASG
jgi:FkbM family methyltransferase